MGALREKSADEALRQIEEKGYLAPWADSPKEKIAVGVNFNSKEKRVEEWEAADQSRGG